MNLRPGDRVRLSARGHQLGLAGRLNLTRGVVLASRWPDLLRVQRDGAVACIYHPLDCWELDPDTPARDDCEARAMQHLIVRE